MFATTNVLPLAPNTKVPMQNCNDYNNKNYDELTKSLYENGYNYGILTGKKSGIIVIDYDTHKTTKNVDLKYLKEFHGNDALIISTPSGGYHVYHKYDETKHGHWKGTCGIDGFIDIRTNGNYIVGPNCSINEKKYEILSNDTPTIMPENVCDYLDQKMFPKKEKKTEQNETSVDDKSFYIPHIEKVGFTNVEFVNDYDFTCDQKGRGTTCPLCKKCHENNHYYMSINTAGSVVVRNHSQRCKATKVYPINENQFDPDEQKLLDLDFTEDYLIMKRQIPIFMVNDSLEYIIDDHTENEIIRLNRKQLEERFYDKWYYVGNKIHYFAKDWLHDPFKTKYKKIDFIPKNCPPNVYNLWKGYPASNWELSEIPGDIEPFMKVVNCITDNNPEYLMKWLAYLIQKPELKPIIGVVFKGAQGRGKSTLPKIIKSLIGASMYYETNDAGRDIFSNFTDAFLRRKLVVINETDAFKFNNYLKTMLSDDTTRCREMYKMPIQVQNLAGIIMTTNENVPVKIEPGDRKFVIYECNDDLKWEENTKFWKDFRENYMTDQANLKAIYDHLMDIDLNDFIIDADRPLTKAYNEIAFNCLPKETKFIHHIIVDKFPKDGEITAMALHREFIDTYGTNINISGFGLDFMKRLDKFGLYNGYVKKDGKMTKKYGDSKAFEKSKDSKCVKWKIDRQIAWEWLHNNGYTDLEFMDLPDHVCYKSWT